MVWIVDKPSSQEKLAERFQVLIEEEKILQIPGAHDAMAALIAKKTGFKALYLSGGAYTASRGLPDLGMVTSTEVADRAKDLIRATNLPVLVDIDTGFGGVHNVARTAREMVEESAAPVQIEEQQSTKKCRYLNGKRLLTIKEMKPKIKDIPKVAPTLKIIALTNANA